MTVIWTEFVLIPAISRFNRLISLLCEIDDLRSMLTLRDAHMRSPKTPDVARRHAFGCNVWSYAVLVYFNYFYIMLHLRCL